MSSTLIYNPIHFLDGKQGLIWHFLQGFWYRFLVDAKIWELKKQFGGDREKIVKYLTPSRGEGDKIGLQDDIH